MSAKKSKPKGTGRRSRKTSASAKEHPTTHMSAVVQPGMPQPGASGPPTTENLNSDLPTLMPEQMREELARRYEELQQQRRVVEEIFARYQDRLIELPEVTGLHVGLRRSKGMVVTPLQYCIRVHVSKKLDKGHPRIQDPLPSQIENVPLDVTEGNYELAAGTGPFDRLVTPIRGGIPIATPTSAQEPSFGTLGKVVFNTDGLALYLTNKHVASGTDQVLQPPNGKVPDAVIGQVIASERNSEIDAALIARTGTRQIAFGLIDTADEVTDGIFLPGTLTQADEHRTKCFKIGAVSGSKDLLGVVKNVNATLVVSGLTMRSQIIVESENAGTTIMQPGDSGSVLIVPRTKDGVEIYMIVGLVHAREDKTGAIVACHFSKVQSRFGISLNDV